MSYNTGACRPSWTERTTTAATSHDYLQASAYPTCRGPSSTSWMSVSAVKPKAASISRSSSLLSLLASVPLCHCRCSLSPGQPCKHTATSAAHFQSWQGLPAAHAQQQHMCTAGLTAQTAQPAPYMKGPLIAGSHAGHVPTKKLDRDDGDAATQAVEALGLA